MEAHNEKGDRKETEAHIEQVRMWAAGNRYKVQRQKMISCPDPENCIGNLRTQWHGRLEDAVSEWDNLVNSFKYTKSGK